MRWILDSTAGIFAGILILVGIVFLVVFICNVIAWPHEVSVRILVIAMVCIALGMSILHGETKKNAEEKPFSTTSYSENPEGISTEKEAAGG